MPALRRLHAGTFPKLWDFSAGAVFPVPTREGARPASVNSVPGFILSYSEGRTYSIKDQQGNIALKDVDFSQAVHIFSQAIHQLFSSGKTACLLRAILSYACRAGFFSPRGRRNVFRSSAAKVSSSPTPVRQLLNPR